MTTAVLTHAAFSRHRTPLGHPERVQRILAVWEALDAPEFRTLHREDAPEASREQLCLAHPEAYVDAVQRAEPTSGNAHLDADTSMSPGSFEAALRAVGAVCRGVDLVMDGACRNAFCAVRPPGHHAERARAMGFCLFGSAAIGALHARRRHGVRRVAVLDFDVHHGNGTQHMFESDPDLLFASTHQMPLFPGTGSESEQGVGNIMNVPLAPFDGGEEFRSAWSDRILPRVEEFGPELIIVSAGFDAHADDPLGQLRLQDGDFEWITRQVLDIAQSVSGARVVSTLEGGYDLGALARSVTVHVRALMQAGSMEQAG